MKTCTHCRIAKPATREFFHADYRGGLRADCKECCNAYQQEWRARLPQELLRAYMRQKKQESLARETPERRKARLDKVWRRNFRLRYGREPDE